MIAVLRMASNADNELAVKLKCMLKTVINDSKEIDIDSLRNYATY